MLGRLPALRNRLKNSLTPFVAMMAFANGTIMHHADIAITGARVADSTVGSAAIRVGASSNFRTIQALRAIAALLVVVYHAFDMWGGRIDSSAPGVGWTNGAAGVDIFFIISGFVMVVSSRRIISQPHAWWTFIQDRIVRIVPLYWLLTTAKLLIVFFFADLALRSSLDFDFVAQSYLFFPVVDGAGHFRPLLPVGWTLTYEFLFYALFALALGLRVDALRVLIPGLGLFVFVALFRTESWPAWTILFNTIVIEFIFGVMLAKVALRAWLPSTVVAVCLLTVGSALILIVPESSEKLRALTWGVPALAIVASAVSLESRLAAALPRWLLMLGDASYSIYLTHGFVLPVLGLLFVYFHWTGLPAEALMVLGSLVASSMVGTAVYTFLEKPVMGSLKRRASAHM
jgi:exopolysaccharide production protein ExoZ